MQHGIGLKGTGKSTQTATSGQSHRLFRTSRFHYAEAKMNPLHALSGQLKR
jgi:hypothetical protein